MIVDASVAVKWVVDEDGSGAAAELEGNKMAAPDLLPVECASALWAKARRGELDPPAVQERVQALLAAPVRLVPAAELVASATQLALELGHPVYDCLYLALALRENDHLVTADRRLVTAVQSEGRYGHLVRELAAA